MTGGELDPLLAEQLAHGGDPREQLRALLIGLGVRDHEHAVRSIGWYLRNVVGGHSLIVNEDASNEKLIQPAMSWLADLLDPKVPGAWSEQRQPSGEGPGWMGPPAELRQP